MSFLARSRLVSRSNLASDSPIHSTVSYHSGFPSLLPELWCTRRSFQSVLVRMMYPVVADVLRFICSQATILYDQFLTLMTASIIASFAIATLMYILGRLYNNRREQKLAVHGCSRQSLLLHSGSTHIVWLLIQLAQCTTTTSACL